MKLFLLQNQEAMIKMRFTIKHLYYQVNKQKKEKKQ